MITAIEKIRKTAIDRLWSSLFSEKQFYAFEFLRSQKIESIEVDFYCPEAGFVIMVDDHLSPEAMKVRKQQRSRLQNHGYHLVELSSKEILEQYQDTVDLLDRQFTALTRFQCG